MELTRKKAKKTEGKSKEANGTKVGKNRNVNKKTVNLTGPADDTEADDTPKIRRRRPRERSI